jgi:hypothetical protein
MQNGQVLANLYSKQIWKQILLNLAYNGLIFPTKTTGKNTQVECKKNFVQ